ncbi:MAG: hypothetical protein ABWZ25_14770 [Chitinophagaceae bacterium]
MEDNYRNDDFEQFVRGQADQHRMFPSEKVWGAVNNALHPRKKWYGFGLAFLLLMTGGAVTWVMNTYPVNRSNDVSVSKSSRQKIAEQKPDIKQPDLRDLSPFSRNTPVSHSKRYQEPVPGPEVGLTAQESLLIAMLVESDDASGELTVQELSTDRSNSSLTIVHSVANKPTVKELPSELRTSALLSQEPASSPAGKPVVVEEIIITEETNISPLTIESVVNIFKAAPKKLSWQFFITPTISNRRLRDNKAFNSLAVAPDPLGSPSNIPFASVPDVNNAVTHKPDLGLQIGVTARYPLKKDLNLTGGFQFNVNRYDIKAFLNNGEVARIELQGNTPTVSTWSSYRSQGVSRLNWLKNYYFSISVPVGAELIVYRNKKASKAFGISGTIQPTYVLQNKAYLISTDYKNYAQVPWLVRHANINTGMEAFMQHTKGKTHWQVGPQFRYQLLSSFNKKYPIKENLFDIGVKLGVTLNK